MGHVVSLDSEGHLVYDGMLSSQEKATIDDILKALKEEIPQVEADLAKVYGKGVLYKYNLGLFLGELLEKYDIANSEYRKFWDEIKTFATKEERKRDEGVNSATRSFYHQCYTLSRLELDVVEKLSWRQWQSVLDRVGNREDTRIFEWIKNYPQKFREDDWREFEKALHLYLKDKDTSVFDDEELFSIYDSLMLMSMRWREKFKIFEEGHPKSAKIKNKGVWAKKFYTRCFLLKKQQRSKVVTEEIVTVAFAEIVE